MYKLRELEYKDLKEINVWRNNPEIISFLGAPFRYIGEEVDRKWYDDYLKNRKSQIRCSIVLRNDKIIGLISLLSIDYINRSAILNIMIGDKKYQNKGIGTLAIKEMLNHAFNNMNLNRIELKVLSNNSRAKKVYKKCGFIKEGTLRKCVFKEGNYVDVDVLSILRSDFKKII